MDTRLFGVISLAFSIIFSPFGLPVAQAQAFVNEVVVPQDGFHASSVVAYASPVTIESQLPTLAQAPENEVIDFSGGGLVLEGEASYYSRAGCLGCDPLMIMANGQPLDDNALTMAIGANLKQYVGYQARVTNLVSGQSVVALITDTGGFYQAKYGHRVADLTIATKQAIGMNGGVGQVRVEIID